MSIYITRHRRKGIYASPNSRYTSSDPSSKSDLEAAGAYFGVPIFSYSELAEATNNFNHEKELGDGGFGTVYYGKFRDGREVAVKRLYEHNYRRVEQFMNEIEILTRLRHKNLVSLYGCTSRQSQGLLLVYEFIPNGTIADHLHGDWANPCLLTWPIRMNIAIETASALVYLHASDIIHRDIKTNNILLDNNFCVKVADFGLSRLFPTDVTHVSTAPQGTPGYVDPEYHQCYQLTDKSDVYSFGVVLIELISSMPAVDISRHKNEINLANLAINRIQKNAVDELVDPCLGFHSDEEVKRMATSVAELAFLCLQQIKEMRPSMDVVLEELHRIKSGECKLENLTREDDDKKELKSTQQPPPSPPHCEESALLKNIMLPPSPISVTENWISNDTTPTVNNGNNTAFGLKLGFGIGVSVLLIVAMSIYIIRRHRKGIYASPNSRYTFSNPSSKSDLEAASAYFGVPIFSYSELAEATNNFNHKKELGDGGFGTVYYGKLSDGREVTVKRLYEHNYRRVEQFMNEIEILTRLRHKNLVSVYGCTSCHSQGLLLVYEFIPNGTIADHLHGDRANPCLLTWPIRMNIAIETASALAYLHASDIIHRNVKTNNILLDNNFCVKVADFELSRLFPTDLTHASTAPQGTPGYVDPEYHQCYQLTDKSDVYSFGVVLIELISSMPAVDTSRLRHEINLANLAITRIQKQAVDELVDPCLGFHSDEEVKRMATSVAELAFLCLQQNKEMRPSMDVVLEELQRIKSEEFKLENLTREDDDDKKELKSMQQPPASPPH
ncbi:hypothetical protein EZV62_018643 [Acer yangbiense]|uniref:Protein kinase domain-containing protein n=1 Tax=Acer yangbiense TaxID=1000413 RepID=A0A5C7HJY5_9ROSI|nr:hypothetical protein EZV62_018643 [Acer yangbiense]